MIPIATTPDPRAVTARSRIRVLVAEDDPDMRTLLGAMLRSRGYEVVCVADGVALLAEIQASMWTTADRGYDLVVSDVHLGDFSGGEIIAATQCGGFTTPAVFITADPGAEAGLRAQGIVPAAFLRKPLDLQALMQRVDYVLAAVPRRHGR